MTDRKLYTNLPWAVGGRDRSGIDCVGLAGLFLREQLELRCEAPGTVDYERVAARLIGRGCVPVNELERGDLLFFSSKPGELSHVAIALGNGDILHATAGGSRIDTGTELLRRVGLKYVATVRSWELDLIAQALEIPSVKGAVTLLVGLVVLSLAATVAMRPKVPNFSNEFGRYSANGGLPLQTMISTEAPLPEILGEMNVAGNGVYQTHLDNTLTVTNQAEQRITRIVVFCAGPVVGATNLRVNGIPVSSKAFGVPPGALFLPNGFQAHPSTVDMAVDGYSDGPGSYLLPSFHGYSGAHDITVPVDIRASYDRDFPIYGFPGCCYYVLRFVDMTRFASGMNATVQPIGRPVRYFDANGFLTTTVIDESLADADGTKVRFKLANWDIKSISSITVNGVAYSQLTATNQVGNVYHLNKTKGYVEFITAPAAAATILVTYTYYQRGISFKPAEHMVYLLTEVLSGKGLDESKINWPSFLALRNYCETAITWNTGSRGPILTERYKTHYVLDVRKPLGEHLKILLDACHAQIFLSGGKFCVKARRDGTSVFSFDETNILVEKDSDGRDRSTFVSHMIDRADRSNRVHLLYRGTQTFSAQTSVTRDDPANQAERAPRIGNDGVVDDFLQYNAVVDESQVERLAETLLAEEVNTRWMVEFKTTIKGLALEPMDLIAVTHSSRPSWSGKLFRIEKIDLDEDDYMLIRALEYFEGAYI